MNKSKFFLIIFGIIVFTAIVLRLTSKEDDWICAQGEWVRHGNPSEAKPTADCPGKIIKEELPTTSETIIGGDKDEHGCLGPAGYSWCEAKQKCLRVWEEKCEIEGAIEVNNDEVIVSNIVSGQLVSSPLTVLGWAKGNWFFEANLPVKIVDEKDRIILSHFGTAQSDWMTEEMVPFKSVLEFNSGEAANGYLEISKDNPSGLSENDASFKIPVRFK